MKKVLAVLLVLTVVICVSAPVFAATPRAVACPNCNGGGLILIESNVTKAAHREALPCIHGYPNGTDRMMDDVQVTSYKCNRCGYVHSEQVVLRTYRAHVLDG